MTSATMSPKKPARTSDAGATPEREDSATRDAASGSKATPKSLREIAAANASVFLDGPAGLETAGAREKATAKETDAAKKSALGPRRRDARVWALQLAYARAMSDEPMDWLERHLRGTAMAEEAELEVAGLLVVPQDADFAFAGSLAKAATDGAERFDVILAGALKNWRVERLTLIDRLVLRIALAEMESHPETPYRVVLNEYIEIAKSFGTPQSARFVNGVLDAAARVIRPREAAKAAAAPADGEPSKKAAKKAKPAK
jgi:N utilization substance protein B